MEKKMLLLSEKGKAEQEKAKKELLARMKKKQEEYADFVNNLSTRVAVAKKGYSKPIGHKLTDNNIGKEVTVSKDVLNGFKEKILSKGDKVIVSHSGGLAKNEICVLRSDGEKVFINAKNLDGLTGSSK
jgi:hypothetical protein